ncbi:MAG: hypothetical protein ACP5FY_12755, partial [Kosmotogaceae bacterium]
IYSLSNLYEQSCCLRKFCDTRLIREEPIAEWWQAEELERNYVYMLNQLLGIHLRSCGLRYNRKFSRNYFPREDTVSDEFKTEWYNVRTGKTSERLTARFYTYGHDEFWRHIAANMSFRRMSRTWFLQIIPKYFYTEDGVRPWDSSRVGAYTTRIKAQERNLHVLNQVLFWSDILSHSSRSEASTTEIRLMLDNHYVMTIERMPLTGLADFAIPLDPAVYEEPTQAPQLSFLDEFSELEGDDDDEF